MKAGIHPEYRDVCFVDLSNGFKFVTRTCANTKETIKMDDGRELPLYKLDTSSESHPFYTGTQKSVDTMGGRVERFRNKYGKTAAKKFQPVSLKAAFSAAFFISVYPISLTPKANENTLASHHLQPCCATHAKVLVGIAMCCLCVHRFI